MISAFATALLVAGTSASAETAISSCAREVQATATAYRLSDLPPAIRADLDLQSNNGMADSGAPIRQPLRWTNNRQTNNRIGPDLKLPTSRFVQALFVKGIWFVSYETTMMGPRTIGYLFTTVGLRPAHFYSFSGPPCEVVKAALKGVQSFQLPPTQ